MMFFFFRKHREHTQQTYVTCRTRSEATANGTDTRGCATERRDVAVSETRGVRLSRERAWRVSTRESTVASRTTTDD